MTFIVRWVSEVILLKRRKCKISQGKNWDICWNILKSERIQKRLWIVSPLYNFSLTELFARKIWSIKFKIGKGGGYSIHNKIYVLTEYALSNSMIEQVSKVLVLFCWDRFSEKYIFRTHISLLWKRVFRKENFSEIMSGRK